MSEYGPAAGSTGTRGARLGGRTAENNRKNNANGQARNAKAACPFIFEHFHKKSPGTSPGHDGAARLGTLDSPRKNTEQKYKA
ncbi:MAG: hypothetical protein MR483_02045 [Bacteroidales bacterium]|nr:hypothetical protein [Bacteroidales bacterium]